MDPIEELDLDQEKAIRFIKEGARVILSCAAIFSLEVIVYTAKGWREDWVWWVTSFAVTGAWLVAPYAGIELLLNRRRLTLRQEFIHLLGAIGIIGFGVIIFLNAYFLQFNWLLYLMVPIYQWLGIAGAWAVSYAVGKTLK